MNVVLISHTPSPIKTVATAAKLCYSDSSVSATINGLTDDSAGKFVDMLSEIGHESPIEHASFTFGIEGVSRSLLAQITRHRMASFSVKSQRYVNELDFKYVTPPAIENCPEALLAYNEAMEQDRLTYIKISKILTENHVRELMKNGMSEVNAVKKAEKMAIEDARFILPNSCETQLIVTMNARSLKNFFLLRCCNRAQWEIHELADRMLSLVREVAPELFVKCGPACLTGPCPEGKMSCEKALAMRKKYAAR
ncbi:MAG: FAD-dependent thymidylate synthase [Clostridia bacterium]